MRKSHGSETSDRWRGSWLRDSDPDSYGATLDRWTAHYARSGISALATGAITLRERSAGEPWWRADRMVTGPQGEGGRQVRNVVEAQDRLAVTDAEALLDSAPRFAGNNHLDQRMRWRDGAWSVESTRVLLDDSAGVAADVDPRALAAILAFDGETPLREIVAAATEGLPDDDVAALASAIVINTRHLAALGTVALGALGTSG